jgi:tetratricopeptide (TPR) repeat protein
MTGRFLSVDEELARAKAAEKHGNMGLAEQIYSHVLQRFPTHKLAKKRLKAIHKGKQCGTPDAAELQRITQLYSQGRLPEACALGDALLAKYPDTASLHNILGVVNARMGQLDVALSHYDKALSVRPDYAEAHNNRGNTLNRMGRHAQAIDSFRAALRILPDYFAAHNNLGNALHDAGQPQDAIASYRQALRIKPDYAEAHNNLGNALVDVGECDAALSSFTRALKYNPGLAQAHNNIGNTLRATGRYDEAAQSYRAAIELSPGYAPAYLGLGNTLNEQGLHRQAIDSISRSIQLYPDSATAHNELGNALSDLGRHADALDSYRAALRIKPDFAEVHSNLGNALCESGNYDEAIGCYEEALRIKPTFAAAHYNLSKYKTYSADDSQLAWMQQRVSDPDASENERMYLSFALGKAYEDIENIEQSFNYLLQANRLRKQEMGYDIHDDRQRFEKIKALFSDARLPALEQTKQPIFIVGMPRSGTTLTEQILASHSQVHGAGELQAVNRILSPLLRDMPLAGGEQISAAMLTELRDCYLDELTGLGVAEPFITDKMPANFRWIGFLLAAMPTAKIINLQREPAASCWSMFSMLLSGNGFSNDLVDVAAYYRLYEDLMAFWRQQFPQQILDLNYELLTEDQESQTRRLLEFCGLRWEEQCLEFHNTKRSVRTASNQQVRKKMYTGSSTVWRKYEAYLESMLSELKSKD